jgi:Cytochrome c oxidase subunit IIa family
MKKYESPQGAVALLVIYVLIIAALWGSAYATLLSRGVTQ